MPTSPQHSLHRTSLLAGSGSVLAWSIAVASAGPPLLPPAWVVFEAGETVHFDAATQIVTSPDGEPTVLGEGYLPETSEDALVLRYDAAGRLRWLHRFDTPEHGVEIPGAIVTAPDGGVWFSVQHAAISQRISVRRLDADGRALWTYTRDVTAADGIFPSHLIPKLAVDLEHGEPRIYATVSDAGAYRLVRLDDTGSELWSIDWRSDRDGAPGRGFDAGHRPTDIDVAADGTIYVTGLVIDSVAFDGAYPTIGVSPDGKVLWSHLEQGGIGVPLTEPFIRAHAGGGAVAAGSLETTCGTFELRVWRIADDGTELWSVVEPGGPCGFTFGPTGLATAPDGRVAVCAASALPGGWRLRVLDARGEELWDRIWETPGTGASIARALAFDAAGGIIATGTGTSPATGFGIVRFDTAGEISWLWTAAGPELGQGISLSITDDGTCYAAARSWAGPAIGERVATLRFDPPRAACPADFDGSGSVDGGDLAAMLGAWGACAGCAADLTGDGAVDGSDLAILLGAWGGC